MTELLNRPDVSSRSSAATDDRTRGRSYPASWLAGAAAVVAVAISLVLGASLALAGWFLADAGSHGETTDALVIGVRLWLLALGSTDTLAGVVVALTPLGLTLVAALVAFRCGRWVGRRCPEPSTVPVLSAIATLGAVYTAVAVVVAVVTPATAGSLPRIALGALVVSGVAGGAGVALGAGQVRRWASRLPRWAAAVLFGAAATTSVTVGVGGIGAGGVMLASLGDTSDLVSHLGLNATGLVSLGIVVAAYAPNLALLGVAWLLGPGFAVGTDTLVSQTAVSLGELPAFPPFAELPPDGVYSPWFRLALAVPCVAAMVGGALAVRIGPRRPSYDLAALCGAGSGFFGGVAVTILIGLAGGGIGTGRLTQIGAPLAETLVFATGLMSVGGLLGALGAAWRRRRTADSREGRRR